MKNISPKDYFKRCRQYLSSLVLITISSISIAYADVNIDIRTAGVLNSEDFVSYTVAIDDCSAITSVTVSAGETELQIPLSDMYHVPGTTSSYEYTFESQGIGKFLPDVDINFVNGQKQSHSESFQVEKNSPQLQFNEIRLADFDGQQHLIISANVQDDIDIQYVGFSAIGLRASDLRSAGGVVEQAKKKAFAATNGVQKIYPLRDDQIQFDLVLPVINALDGNAIAHDGLVLLDIVAVDSSGNKSSLSQISFTGDDVVEEASDLQVTPSTITFTNLLETVKLIPSVKYQFRGRTPVLGLDTGITFQSSHPGLVAVTSEGLVYPLAEIGDETISITISFPTLDSVVIPVQIDLTKQLVSLKSTGQNAQGLWVMDRLNTWLPLPSPIVAVFDDGSEAEISEQFPLEYVFDESNAAIFEIDPALGMLGGYGDIL